jgi:hypothetical protein
MTNFKRVAMFLTSAVIAAVASVAQSVPASANTPPYTLYSYAVNYSYYTCSYNQLTAISNYTGQDGSFTVGQAVGSTFTFSGKISGTVGNASKLSSDIGFSYSSSRTLSASGTFTLHPLQTLSLNKGYTDYLVTESARKYVGGVYTSTSTRNITVSQPNNVCVRIS